MNCGFLIESKISDLLRSKIRQALRCQQHHYYHAHTIIHYLLVAQVLFINRPGIHKLDSARQNLSGPATFFKLRWETYWKTFIHSHLDCHLENWAVKYQKNIVSSSLWKMSEHSSTKPVFWLHSENWISNITNKISQGCHFGCRNPRRREWFNKFDNSDPRRMWNRL